MAKTEFVFNPYPVQYRAKYHQASQKWTEELKILEHAQNEAALPEDARRELQMRRNYGGDLPIVNYSTQYGFACFEGLKAYPTADGGMALFRPDQNAKRFFNSMEGMLMPGFPPELFVRAAHEMIQKSRELGFAPAFNKDWARDNFATARGTYLRPFSYSEGGFGINITKEPWVIMMAAQVGNYVELVECPSLVVSERVRASAHGTGWIKCSANYVTSILAKQEAHNKGHHEALFLDGAKRMYVEECSSCNVFFVMKNGVIVTPELGDTILPGITRASVIQLARDAGHTVEERAIGIDEAMHDAAECFSTGTAVGISHFGQITHGEKTARYGSGAMGDVTRELQKTLKMIQHGLLPDAHGWVQPVAS